jgi:hypothetical protein
MLGREGSPHSRDDLRHDHELEWTPKNARISCDETEELVGRPLREGSEIGVPALAPVGRATWRPRETLHAWRLGPKKRVKAARRGGWLRWKGRRKRLPKSLFSATLSQIHTWGFYVAQTGRRPDLLVSWGGEVGR